MRVTFSQEAEDQFREIQAALREINSHLAKRFAAEVRNAVWRLENFPQSGQKISTVRRVLLRRARYLMLYEITGEQIYISKLVHQKQRQE